MSGGSYNYAFSQVENFESDLRDKDTHPMRGGFAQLLLLVANAMHDIEWVDSGDYGHGDENEAIDKVFSFLGASPEVIAKAHAYDGLREMLERYLNAIPK